VKKNRPLTGRRDTGRKNRTIQAVGIDINRSNFNHNRETLHKNYNLRGTIGRKKGNHQGEGEEKEREKRVKTGQVVTGQVCPRDMNEQGWGEMRERERIPGVLGSTGSRAGTEETRIGFGREKHKNKGGTGSRPVGNEPTASQTKKKTKRRIGRKIGR